MRNWLQRLLSIDTIHCHLMDIRENRLSDRKLLNQMETELNSIRAHSIVANRGMARLLAKLDPEYNRDEFSKDKRAESDRIGDQVMARLLAEHKASNPS